MKKQLTIFVIGVCLGLAIPAANAAVEFSAGIQISSRADFYQPLAPLGIWVNIPSYGRCWHPRVAAQWRPYEDGEWVWTDAGWYWESDDPGAWACYHYGDWVDDANYGWCWIPGTEWAPAWVTWRVSDDYIGWAPCGPEESVLPASVFVFVDVHHFRGHLRRSNFIVNNTTVINRTRVVNNFTTENININGREQRIRANRGPGVDRIQRATGQKFTQRPVQDLIRQTRMPKNFRQNAPQQQQQPQPQYQQQRPSQTQPVRPTGREQQRQYQPQQPERREAVPPTGREQPPQYQPQQPEHKPTPQRPQEFPPTGNERQRHYQEVPKPAPERPREITPPARPAQPAPEAPRERPMPPTGREHKMTPPAAPPHEAPGQRERIPQSQPSEKERKDQGKP